MVAILLIKIPTVKSQPGQKVNWNWMKSVGPLEMASFSAILLQIGFKILQAETSENDQSLRGGH